MLQATLPCNYCRNGFFISIFVCIAINRFENRPPTKLSVMPNGHPNKTFSVTSHNGTTGHHGGVKNSSCIPGIDAVTEDCKVDVLVVIVVVMVILGWFIGYIFLQKAEERKEKKKQDAEKKQAS